MARPSLFDSAYRLPSTMAAIRASMREVAGAEESEGRKLLVEKLNELSRQSGIKLTGGHSASISKATLDKWLSPTDTSHQPSILALLAFCKVTGSLEPLRVVAQALGADLMTLEDRNLRDYAQAILDERAARKRKHRLEKEL